MHARAETERPFGAPDAAGADLDSRAFIPFADRRFKFGLGMRPDDSSIRVITGGKGAGKTHYLRRMQTALSADKSVYVDQWRISYPATAHVLRLWSWSETREQCRDRWMRTWRRAIMRSTASHLLHDRRLRRKVPDGIATHLRDGFPELIPDPPEGPETAVHQLERILDSVNDGAALDRYVSHGRWDAFRRVLVEAVSQTMPMYFILDGLDEKFEMAPSQWLDCQAGLLREILESRSDLELGRHLHLVAGVRDVVYSTTQRSEHLTRVYGAPGIRRLRWDAEAIGYFLQEKARALDPDEYHLRPDRGEPVTQWLGIDTIWNLEKQIQERIEEYLVRHTRLIPRDVIQLGNALCECVDEACVNHEPQISEDAIRATVSSVAKRFGDEQLLVVGNHVTADLMPREAIDYQFIEVYIDTDAEHYMNSLQSTTSRPHDDYGRAYADAVVDDLRMRIRAIGEDRHTRVHLSTLRDGFQEKFGQVDILSTLWQHRLLGYIRGSDRLQGNAVFYGPNSDDSLSIPLDYDYYAFAPILIDSIEGLRGVGDVIGI